MRSPCRFGSALLVGMRSGILPALPRILSRRPPVSNGSAPGHVNLTCPAAGHVFVAPPFIPCAVGGEGGPDSGTSSLCSPSGLRATHGRPEFGRFVTYGIDDGSTLEVSCGGVETVYDGADDPVIPAGEDD